MLYFNKFKEERLSFECERIKCKTRQRFNKFKM